MNKSNVSKVFRTIGRAVTKHSPEILVGIGITGMISTTVLAVKATPKALELIEEEKQRQNHELAEEEAHQIDRLKPLDVVKVAWKPYIPAVVTGAASVACLIGANSVHSRRNAALATAYKLSETALSEYREKVIETIGDKKEKVVRDKIAKDKIDKKPVTKSEVIITEKGNTLCYDALSGRYFKSDIDLIRKAENELNKRMLQDMYISLNELYDELDLDHTTIGDEIGWNLDDGLIEICFSSQIADDDTPCIVMDYRKPPKYKYSSLV